MFLATRTEQNTKMYTWRLLTLVGVLFPTILCQSINGPLTGAAEPDRPAPDGRSFGIPSVAGNAYNMSGMSGVFSKIRDTVTGFGVLGGTTAGPDDEDDDDDDDDDEDDDDGNDGHFAVVTPTTRLSEVAEWDALDDSLRRLNRTVADVMRNVARVHEAIREGEANRIVIPAPTPHHIHHIPTTTTTTTTKKIWTPTTTTKKIWTTTATYTTQTDDTCDTTEIISVDTSTEAVVARWLEGLNDLPGDGDDFQPNLVDLINCYP